MSDTGESLFSCERCGADRLKDRNRERRLIFEIVYLCWSCYRLASEDEGLMRACCDCDALGYSGRKQAEGVVIGIFHPTTGDMETASDMFYVARQKSLAAVKAFLASGKKKP